MAVGLVAVGLVAVGLVGCRSSGSRSSGSDPFFFSKYCKQFELFYTIH